MANSHIDEYIPAWLLGGVLYTAPPCNTYEAAFKVWDENPNKFSDRQFDQMLFAGVFTWEELGEKLNGLDVSMGSHAEQSGLLQESNRDRFRNRGADNAN